ncbi:MAG: CcmD family protein [Bacteroidetes bacterium]|nr:CcmD family protein [Bacteroidota bacterium]
MNKWVYTLLFALSTILVKAQEPGNGPQMADSFREDGKIYVVISVLSIVFTALIVYLISIDIKLKRVEQKNKQ